MGRANISDFDKFLTIAEYLERMGWIAEADAGVSGEVAQSTIGSQESIYCTERCANLASTRMGCGQEP